MTNTQQFIIALLTVFIPVAIPAIITLIFAAQKTRLEKLKALTEQNKEFVSDLIKTVQSAYKNFNGQEKYDWVLMKASEKIHLPKEQLQVLIESTLMELQKAFGDAWDSLGTPTP